jgi:hypothetical protein
MPNHPEDLVFRAMTAAFVAGVLVWAVVTGGPARHSPSGGVPSSA